MKVVLVSYSNSINLIVDALQHCILEGFKMAGCPQGVVCGGYAGNRSLCLQSVIPPYTDLGNSEGSRYPAEHCIAIEACWLPLLTERGLYTAPIQRASWVMLGDRHVWSSGRKCRRHIVAGWQAHDLAALISCKPLGHGLRDQDLWVKLNHNTRLHADY